MPATDPTLETVARFDDPEQWDCVLDNVPIFTAHEALDGDGKLKYRIDRAALQKTAEAINRNFKKKRKPIKLFIGHTKDPKTTPQTEQPPLVGYAINARVGDWGPDGEPAILTKWFIRRGKKKDIEEFPERSPEFFPNTNEITAVALLKTDPRLNMGMLTYARPSDGCVLYMRGMPMPVAEKENEDITTTPGLGTRDDYEDPETPEPEEDEEIEELSPEEANKFMKHMKSCYGKTAHGRQLMKAHAKRYGLEMPSAKNASMPALPEAEGDKGKEKVSMGRDEVAVHYQLQKMERRVKVLEKQREFERENYSRTMSTNLVNNLIHLEHIKIANPSREIEKMSKMDDAGRKEYADDIRVNYAKEESAEDPDTIDLRVLTAQGMIPAYTGIEGGPAKEEEPVFGADASDTDAAVMYCEENHLDPTKESDWQKCMKAVIEAKKAAKTPAKK